LFSLELDQSTCWKCWSLACYLVSRTNSDRPAYRIFGCESCEVHTRKGLYLQYWKYEVTEINTTGYNLSKRLLLSVKVL